MNEDIENSSRSHDEHLRAERAADARDVGLPEDGIDIAEENDPQGAAQGGAIQGDSSVGASPHGAIQGDASPEQEDTPDGAIQGDSAYGASPEGAIQGDASTQHRRSEDDLAD